MKISINASKMKITLLGYGEVALSFKSFRSSELTSTLTYVFVDNFCPCFVEGYSTGFFTLKPYANPMFVP